MENSSKRIVVVTGGSKGIGKSVCLSFADPHTTIYFTYYSDEHEANKTSAFIARMGSKAIPKKIDVSHSEEVSGFFMSVLDQDKHIDVLVNNAGTSSDSLLVRMKEENWDRVVDVNLKGTFNCIKASSKTMIKQKYGRIINIASIVGLTGNSGQSNYAASKAGIIGLTKATARELASRNITVNAVAPGYIDTAMTMKKDETSNTILNQIPLGRKGKPDEVSSLVHFLASEKASYITGQVISVNGGLYM